MTLYKLINLVLFWGGTTLIFQGGQRMAEAGYTAPEMPLGWISGMIWITAGGVLAGCWITFVLTHVVDQKCHGTPRWSTAKLLTTGLPLLGAACLATTGTYVTWQHPYRLAPCDCSLDEWGPNCAPCRCGQHGQCDSGRFGTGQCLCELNWAGPRCDQCGSRWKGTACDQCKTGYRGAPACASCARGYDGDACDTCADGWKPWHQNSTLFPRTISEDDHRHLCDECLPNHWGYDCKRCPIGNDVPLKTLEKSEPIVKGTIAAGPDGVVGTVHQMQIYQQEQWLPGYNYDVHDQKVLEHVRVQLLGEQGLTGWYLLEELRGVQCNNRGICNDDTRHQQQNPDWHLKCTPTRETCTTNADCTVSENCKGTCQGTELPIPALWSLQLPAGKSCSSDTDCMGPTIQIDATTNTTYRGGRCVSRVCCQESYHGDGQCDCDAVYFGRKDPNQPFEHANLSPACDFCPGYDWISEEPSSICSGAKGTCVPDYSRSGDYLKMRCICGTTVYVLPETQVYKNVDWYGDLCQCGDWNNDLQCDTCASGYWGQDCQQCPGGYGLRACSGHGRCDGSGSSRGTGRCECDVKEPSSWMLSPYVKRYPSEKVGYDALGTDLTCSECAPNYWGEECSPCDGFHPSMDMIRASELKHIFQPGGSFSLGLGMSSAEPMPICHPDKPWICTLACGRGGWCNWGRTGDGTCTCWSNKLANPVTYNPLDNVCIGPHAYVGPIQDYQGDGEQCPSPGYCSLGGTGREDFTQCATTQECAADTLGECYPWMQIDFAPRTWGFSCTASG